MLQCSVLVRACAKGKVREESTPLLVLLAPTNTPPHAHTHKHTPWPSEKLGKASLLTSSVQKRKSQIDLEPEAGPPCRFGIAVNKTMQKGLRDERCNGTASESTGMQDSRTQERKNSALQGWRLELNPNTAERPSWVLY